MAEKKEKKAKNIHEVKIEINGDEWSKKIDDAFKKVIKTVKIDGFRPGKAPRNIYEQKYGKASLVMEAVDAYMQDAYKEALEKALSKKVEKMRIYSLFLNSFIEIGEE